MNLNKHSRLSITILICILIITACAPNIQKLLNNEDIEGLIEALENEKSAEVRVEAADALGVLGDPNAIDSLIFTLSDEDPDVRRAAESSLGKFRDMTVIPKLIQALNQVQDQALQEKLIELLVSYEDQAVDPLIAHLGTNQEDIQKLIISTLVQIGEPAISGLIESLDDPNPTVQSGARLALIGIGRPAAKALIEILDSETSELQLHSMDVLKDMGTMALEPLILALDDQQHEKREHVITLLKEIGEPAIEPLIQALGDENLCLGASDCLVEMGDQAVKPLITALSIEDLQEPAEDTLIAMEEIALPALIETYESDPEKTDLILRPLVYGLSVENPVQRNSVYKTLNEIGEPAIPTLLSMVYDINKVEVNSQVQALMSAMGEPAIPYMINTIRENRLVHLAEEALIAIGSPAVPELIKTLADEDPEVRSEVVYILGRIDDDRAISSIISSLEDSSPAVRIQAANALSLLRLDVSYQALINTLNDKDRSVVNAVKIALTNIGSPVVDPLLSAYHSQDDSNNRAIEEILLGIFDQNKSKIIETANKVCLGQAQSTASEYSRYAAEFHPFLIMDNGKLHKWSQDIPVDWLPYSPQDLELVVCLGEYSEVVVQVCDYYRVDTGAYAFSKTRYRFAQKSALYSAFNANQIGATTLFGPYPDACPKDTKSTGKTIYGDPVDSSALLDWLAAFGISWSQ